MLVELMTDQRKEYTEFSIIMEPANTHVVSLNCATRVNGIWGGGYHAAVA